MSKDIRAATNHSSAIHRAGPMIEASWRVTQEATMLRKLVIALAALIAIGTLTNTANARWAGGARWHGGGGHWHGGWHGGHWHGGGWGWGWPAAVGFGLGYGAGYYGAGYYGAGYYGYGYPYYGGCYRRVQVHTRYGWRWRRVWVCG
jgi:hypothetical protein